MSWMPYSTASLGPKMRLSGSIQRLPDNVTVNPGTEYRLADGDWLIAETPYSPHDRIATADPDA